ncbi:WXG100 family type VII secretion target [Microbacterium gilvum]|uniref:WXG100 family type VII secretion target n=1 Tax=Microbacterium gilvum TaxID=1336204 RepID=A0ABP9A1A2_9MICO
MTDQQADVAELQALEQAMTALVGYCDALRSGASGFAYMLPNDWQGPAMQAFLGAFNAWALGAEAMRMSAEGLQQQVHSAKTSYEGAIASLDQYATAIEQAMSA